VLQCEDIGMGLTESLAMTPAASVSGFYIATRTAPTSTWARSATTSLQDLATRRGATAAELQRLLAPNL
jgi:5-methyltetrahydrofolate--homocysteine methyltransferase